jgi:hypothetical protein
VVGAQFDTVFNNSGYLLQHGNPADGAAQTLNLIPGEGGFAELDPRMSLRGSRKEMARPRSRFHRAPQAGP